MKKFFIILSVLSVLFSTTYAQRNVVVTAMVGNQNSVPRVVSVNPSGDPLVVRNGKSQSFSFTVEDVDNDRVYYTISVEEGNGILYPTNGELANGNGSVNFTYNAPSGVGFKQYPITITLNDTYNFSQKLINIVTY